MKLEARVEQQPLRIAMVAACPFPSPRGSQVLIRELAQYLARRGHTVHVVTYPCGESLLPLHGIFVHRIRPMRLAANPGLGWRRVILDALLVWRLLEVVRRERIDVIHAHNYEGPLIGYIVRHFTGVPVVYHSHNAMSDELAYYFKAGWRRVVARWVGRVLDHQIPPRADFSIALTPELEEFLCRCGVAASRVALVPPGSAPPAATAKVGNGPDQFAGRFVVMYTGNLDPYQGLDVLVSGFAAFQRGMPHALLAIVTHERDWAQRVTGSLQELVRDGRARVIVVPAFSAVRRLLARADVLVCPRSSWSGFPIKLLNYLAAGRPVVAAAGSAKSITDERTGLIFPDGDAQGLASALHRLALDPWLRRRLGEHARAATHAFFDWERAASQIEHIYGRVCPGRTRDTAPLPPAGSVAPPVERVIAKSFRHRLRRRHG
jgi:1,2-diacylglycerol 3-alpha-glucosyltransferase